MIFTTQRRETQHILVVEDEEHLATGIRFNLEAEGYRVSTARDGAAALAVFQKQEDPVDLVILDIMLPGMSGYAVCETIRSSGGDVPILMLSARTLAEDRTRGFDADIKITQCIHCIINGGQVDAPSPGTTRPWRAYPWRAP